MSKPLDASPTVPAAPGLASPEALAITIVAVCSADDNLKCHYPDCSCRLAPERGAAFLAALAPYVAADMAAAVEKERERIVGQIEALMAEQADNIVQNVREPIEPSPEANVRLAAQVEFLARWASTIRSGT